MIVIKDQKEIFNIKSACKMASQLLDFIEPFVKPNIDTLSLNNLCHQWCLEHGVIPAPLNYKGFPKSICTSVNDVVCHGIPNKEQILKDGDIINIDVTLIINGYHGDTSRTFLVGDVSEGAKKLVERTKKALEIGIQAVHPKNYFYHIGEAIEKYIQQFNYGIVREFGGHGIGEKFHEDPFVPHYLVSKKERKKSNQFIPGMVFTVEPMINQGHKEIFIDNQDGWTVFTKDHSLSAQFEHTILVTKDGCEILTDE